MNRACWDCHKYQFSFGGGTGFRTLINIATRYWTGQLRHAVLWFHLPLSAFKLLPFSQNNKVEELTDCVRF